MAKEVVNISASASAENSNKIIYDVAVYLSNYDLSRQLFRLFGPDFNTEVTAFP